MTDVTNTCPDCGSASLRYRVAERNWRCRKCGIVTDAPDEREIDTRPATAGGLSDIGKALLDADPEDV